MDGQVPRTLQNVNALAASGWTDDILESRYYTFDGLTEFDEAASSRWVNEAISPFAFHEDAFVDFMGHDRSNDDHLDLLGSGRILRWDGTVDHNPMGQWDLNSSGLQNVSGSNESPSHSAQRSLAHTTPQTKGLALRGTISDIRTIQHARPSMGRSHSTDGQWRDPELEQDASIAESIGLKDDSDEEDSDIEIGIALKNGRFKCNLRQCTHKTFNRLPELRRHYTTVHADRKPEFWCSVPFCSRGAASGGQAFRRKYRLKDHMRKIHGGTMKAQG